MSGSSLNLAVSSDMAIPHMQQAGEVSIVRGGPFYRAQLATRILTPDKWNLGRRVIFALAIGWVPLVLITLFFDPASIGGLLTDYSINVRMLIAVPVLLLGQQIMEKGFRTTVGHVRDAKLLSPSQLLEMDGIIGGLTKLRDSMIAELVVAVAVYAEIVGRLSSHIPFALPWMLSGPAGDLHLSFAGWYHALISQFILQFLLGISLWKWLLWVGFLFRLSRLRLQLVPTHPDQHGGLGFLAMSPKAIVPTLFVVAAAIGCTWRAQVIQLDYDLMSFKIMAIVLLLIAFIVAIGPLIFFVPRLAALRREGLLEYGTLGQEHSMEFQKKWIEGGAGDEPFLTAPEISTLTDFAASYEKLEKLQPFPADKGAFIQVAVAVAIPMLPVILAKLPLATVLKGLMGALK